MSALKDSLVKLQGATKPLTNPDEVARGVNEALRDVKDGSQTGLPARPPLTPRPK